MKKAPFRLSPEKLIIFGYFTITILLGSLALSIPLSYAGGGRLGYVDALFTATSAVCVTGLVTIDTAKFSLIGQTIILVLIQMGGLGLVALTTVFIMTPRSKVSLVNRGIIRDFSIEEIEHDPKRIIRNILIVTLSFEAAGAIILIPAFRAASSPRPAFDGVFHAVSAFCNAGFSTFPTSLEGYATNAPVLLTVAILIVAGGLGFIVVEDIASVAFRRKRRLAFYSGTVLRTTALLIVIGAVFFTAAEWNGAFDGLSPVYKALGGLFQSITPRTAGFNSVPQSGLGPFSGLLTMGFMFIGGSSGSTAGGIKTSTFFILMALAFRGTDETNGTIPVRGRAIPNRTVIKAVQIALKALLLVIGGMALLCAAEAEKLASGEIRLIEAIFEAISAFGTVGLSLGVTGKLSALGKIIIIALMYSGRVGIVAMALPRPGKRIESLVDFASADHIVG